MLTVDEAEIVLGKVFLAKERRDKPVIKTVILSSADRSDPPTTKFYLDYTAKPSWPAWMSLKEKNKTA